MSRQEKLFFAVLSILFSLSPAAHGAAGFQTAQSYPVGTNPIAVAVGDFLDRAPILRAFQFGLVLPILPVRSAPARTRRTPAGLRQ